jgi:hypothetical protein
VYIQQYWHFVEHYIAHPQITVGLEQNVPIEDDSIANVVMDLSNNSANF